MLRKNKKKDSFLQSISSMNETLQRLSRSSIIKCFKALNPFKSKSKYHLFSKENADSGGISPVKFENNSSTAYINLIKLLCNYEDIDKIRNARTLNKKKGSSQILMNPTKTPRLSSGFHSMNTTNTKRSSIANINKS